MPALIIDHSKCAGCRSCELACSFHHGRVFDPRRASLYIRRMEKEGDMSIVLSENLKGHERGNRFPCNMCVDESEPQCVKFCVPGAITLA